MEVTCRWVVISRKDFFDEFALPFVEDLLRYSLVPIVRVFRELSPVLFVGRLEGAILTKNTLVISNKQHSR